MGTELRIAEDGEICSRGPHVFAGYLADPERTAETVVDGWLHTGDLGRLDDEGNLSVIGRKKEILVPSSGHNVSPVPIEAALKECPHIGQACVVGDGRPHLAALLVLEPGTPVTEPDVLAEVDAHVAAVNQRFARAEQVRSHRVLAEEWLPNTELMTPTMKMKRPAIHQRYAGLIEEMYRP
jgi:long-chain acyl-CoA synthetase